MRFTVTYRVFTQSADQAAERAAGIALEQTVEIPRDVVPKGYIEDTILGKVERVSAEAEGSFVTDISYSPDSVGGDFAQLLNVMFGNSSIQKDIKVLDFDLCPELEKQFPGPAFGIEGVRQRVNRPVGPLISPVIKPQGSSADTLAEIAYRCVIGGADVIKDDHGLVDQHMAPFKERCEKISAAVARANKETGRSAAYFPNIAGDSSKLMEFARFAKDAGAGGLLIMPGLFGFDLVRRLSADRDIDLPIMTHPTFLGPYVLSNNTGFSHGALFGAIQRLAGSDISVFPNVGGRFGFSAEECLSIASACRDTSRPGKTIFPSPGGGMSVALAGDMQRMYGTDVVYLLGGSLLRYGDRIGEGIADMHKELAKQSRN